MATTKKKTASEKKEELATTDAQLAVNDDVAAQLAEIGGMGKENITDVSMLMIPRLSVLQQLSPQANENDDAFIEGAKQGMLFENVTQQLFSGEEGLEILVCHHRHTFLEWKLRTKGGGLVTDHGSDPTVIANGKVRKDDDGRQIVLDRPDNHIVETHEYMLLVNLPEGWKPMMMSTTVSTIKEARRLNSLTTGYRVNNSPMPSFGRSYRLKTSPKKNDKGSFFVWGVMPERPLAEIEGAGELLTECKHWHESTSKGETKVKEDETQVAEDQPVDSDDI